VDTAEGPLALHQRGDSFLLTIAGRVLMTSVARRSEEALATLGLAPIARRESPRVLVGGLGLGFTLRATLDALPADASVTVAELNAVVVRWCQGPLAALTGGAVLDPRVRVFVGDVADAIRRGLTHRYDAILLDLYEGPHGATQGVDDAWYGPTALAMAHAALSPGGVLAVWSEDPDSAFPRRMERAGFDVTVHRGGRGGGGVHLVYVGVRRGRRQGR
jgi:spermidine synthase